MKNYILLLVAIFTIHFTNAQSERTQVEETLKKYMDGSSYAKLEMLESAFIENATLYLSGRDGFKRYSPKEYVAFFKNAEKGKFNGRYAKVLEIEVIKDIATAKVEIAIPERKMVYIDLFLLKKFEDGWKIISKTATRVDDLKEEEKTDIEAEKAIIIKNAENFSGYIMASDYDNIDASYSRDAKIFPTNMKIVEGKDIKKYWVLPEGFSTTHHKVFPEEITIINDTAYDYGYYEGKTKNEKGEESSWKGKYIIIWKKEDGNWKMYLDIWNNVRD